MRLVSLEDLAWADARGWGLRPLDAAGLGTEDLGDVHLVSIEPGAVRGNHVHPDTTEWMIVLGAEVTAAARGPDGAVTEARVGGGGPALVVFEPGEAHAVRGEGPGTAFLLCYADGEPVVERVDALL